MGEFVGKLMGELLVGEWVSGRMGGLVGLSVPAHVVLAQGRVQTGIKARLLVRVGVRARFMVPTRIKALFLEYICAI